MNIPKLIDDAARLEEEVKQHDAECLSARAMPEEVKTPGVAAVAVGSALPSVLRLNAYGQLYCADGREVTAYLREWAQRAGVTEDTPLNIMRREDQQRERDDAWLARNWAS